MTREEIDEYICKCPYFSGAKCIDRTGKMTDLKSLKEKIEDWPNMFSDGKTNFIPVRDVLDLIDSAVEQEPCNDTISRQAVLDAISRIGLFKSDTKEVQAVAECLRAVESLSPVAPQSKTGHWIIVDDCEKFIAKCSECGQIEDSRMISKYPYCHCGARMVEPQESEEV